MGNLNYPDICHRKMQKNRDFLVLSRKTWETVGSPCREQEEGSQTGAPCAEAHLHMAVTGGKSGRREGVQSGVEAPIGRDHSRAVAGLLPIWSSAWGRAGTQGLGRE